MAIFVRAANPIWYLPDLVGLPLNDEYWAIFLSNVFPYIPQAPTHDPEGLIPWAGGKVQFQPNGTLNNELYFNPDLVYRIEVRHGQTSADPLIYEVNNFVPESGSVNNNNDLLGGDNQITNPQFQDVSFVSPYTYTQVISSTYTVNVAPGWELVLTGQGTTVLTQLTQAGTDDIQGNPPYAIRINNTGWSSALLRQRFNDNGAIFANGAIAMSATVRGTATVQDLTFTYSPSAPGTPIEILASTAPVGSYAVLQGAVNLPASSNTNVGDAAYVDIIIQLEGTGEMDITNVQILGQSEPLPTDFDVDTDTPLFIEQTIERQKDNEFHYYADSLLVLPKKSLAVGWNFRNNPWQFNSGAGTTVSTTPIYTADQTIVVSSAANSISVSRCTNPTGLFQIQALVGTPQGQIGVFQWIDSASFRPYWGYRFSVLVRARILTSNGTSVRVKVRAFTINGFPDVMTAVDPIASWDASGNPVFSANYTGIQPDNDPVYILQNNYETDDGLLPPVCPAMAFNNFNISPQLNSSDNVTVGIMVYTIDALNSTVVDTILIEEITFVPNPFAMDGLALTYDETLRECRYFYEKSYNAGDIPGANAPNGVKSIAYPAITDGSTTSTYPTTFNLEFVQTKRNIPVVTFYTPAGTIGNVLVGVDDFNGNVISAAANKPLTQWTLTHSSIDRFFYALNNTTTVIYTVGSTHLTYQTFMQFHYTADARMGLF